MIDVYSESHPRKCEILVSHSNTDLCIKCFINEESTENISFELIEGRKHHPTGESEAFYCSLGFYLFQGKKFTGPPKVNIFCF